MAFVQELRAENAHIKHELWALHQRLASSDAEVGQIVAKAHGMESEVCSLTRYKSTARTGVTSLDWDLITPCFTTMNACLCPSLSEHVMFFVTPKHEVVPKMGS